MQLNKQTELQWRTSQHIVILILLDRNSMSIKNFLGELSNEKGKKNKKNKTKKTKPPTEKTKQQTNKQTKLINENMYVVTRRIHTINTCKCKYMHT